MKAVELVTVGSYSAGGRKYRRGQLYRLTDRAADELLARQSGGVPYFREVVLEVTAVEVERPPEPVVEAPAVALAVEPAPAKPARKRKPKSPPVEV